MYSLRNAGGGTSKQRNTNLELFRIVVMLLIVASHYIYCSGLEDIIFEHTFSMRSVFLLLFGAWGKTGINCFVLITGYFMCKSRITVKKFAKLLIEIEFYKIIIYFVLIVFGYEAITLKGVMRAVMPVMSISNGFVGCYLVFFLLIPFINVLIQGLNQKQHVLLITLLLFTYTFLGTLPLIDVRMNYLTWFTVLYLIASYVRLYPKKCFENGKLWGFCTAGMLLLSAVSVVVMTYFAARFHKTSFTYPHWFVQDCNKILAVTLSFSAFLFFKNLKIKENKLINTIAASTFGVLLIHDNCEPMREWLWRTVFNNIGMYNSSYLVLHAVGSVIAVYTVCTAIDYLRIRFLEKPFFKLWDRYYDSMHMRISTVGKRLCQRLSIQNDE